VNRLDDFENEIARQDLDPRIQLVLEYARRHLGSDLALSHLAVVGNVCSWHLCRLFRAELKISPGRCVKLLRLSRAAYLLVTTPLSVKQVMATVGIKDASHFVRDFKDAVGESPVQHRVRFRAQTKSMTANTNIG